MNIIGLRVFPLSVTEEDAIWFTELSYNSTYTWDQFKNMFLARYYLVFKNLNHKDRVNNFMALVREFVSISWE